MESKDIVSELNRKLKNKTPEQIIAFFIEKYNDKIALSSSLGAEDQILTHMIASINKSTKIFTLDTGRCFQESYDLIDKTNKKYDIKIQIYFPDNEQVEKMVNEKGANLFYKSVENRKLCCKIRKLEPLQRAFKSLDVWICGLRQAQSITRINAKLVEWDEKNNLIKLNPLIEWTEEQVWKYIKEKDIPYNVLHDKGYPSIGCKPCTRAIEKGEDLRAGRWWWEAPESKECGLHIK
ncbi:MAG: phosphoadenylyl-sulfate reductase [Bacteroidetes bacterium]|nr:phosphoadenylyl-sulfate reductase [Bacteroidota bacterium]